MLESTSYHSKYRRGWPSAASQRSLCFTSFSCFFVASSVLFSVFFKVKIESPPQCPVPPS